MERVRWESQRQFFVEMDYVDVEADSVGRHVVICPLYALSQMNRILLDA